MNVIPIPIHFPKGVCRTKEALAWSLARLSQGPPMKKTEINPKPTGLTKDKRHVGGKTQPDIKNPKAGGSAHQPCPCLPLSKRVFLGPP